MGDLALTLTAISAGAVFMGANTYIGNAPNFMVKAIAEENGVKMPSFFGYMLWSCAVLVPLLPAGDVAVLQLSDQTVQPPSMMCACPVVNGAVAR